MFSCKLSLTIPVPACCLVPTLTPTPDLVLFSVQVSTSLLICLFPPWVGGIRPDGWFDEASHVIVNTELGMFGTGILPLTRWDKKLVKEHPRPDFQPLEHMVSGMYLGEIVRLIMIEAIESTGLLGGVLPSSLTTNYTLGTDTLSMIER